MGLRYDPATNKVYHLKFDPPPKNSQIESRLIRKATDTESSTKARLLTFRKNLQGLLSAFKQNVTLLSYSEGIMGNEEVVYKDVFNVIGKRPLSKGPRLFKIFLAGLPGSGKTRVAEMLSSRFGFVHGKF